MVLSKNNVFKQIFWHLPYATRYRVAKILKPKAYRFNQELRHLDSNGDVQSLFGYDQLKCVFVHIPKTGGLSISKTLFNNLGGSHRSISDYSLIFNQYEFTNYYKFTLVRNPFDRLASAYFFLKKGGFNPYDKNWFQSNIAVYQSFEEFVLNWVNPKNVFTGIHFVPQYKFISINNQIVMNDVFKHEEIDDAFNSIAKRLNFSGPELSNLNVGIEQSNYKELYSKQMVKVVKKTYSPDFQLFDY